jgi:nucleotide-binding universal stress UspA family protein
MAMKPVQCILHPTDFSPRSRYSFRYACLLARELGARLVVLHVVPPPPVAMQGEMIAYLPPSDRQNDELRDKLQEFRSEEPTVAIEHFLEEGDPASVILQVAQTTPCDLIVMGTHGRTGLARLLMGSVAEAVVRKAPCAVLTVKVPTEKAATLEPLLQTTAHA